MATGTFQLTEEKYKKAKNKSRTNVINNPIFIESQKFITDDYWINFFTDLAHNKLPKGFKYSEGCLCFRKPGKIYKIKLDQNPELAAKQIVDFFHQYADIYSPQEKNSIESEEREDVTWKSLKNIEKKAYLNRYINRMIKKWNLKTEEAQNFSNVINNGVSDGSIKSKRIIIKNKEIDSIDDIQYKDKKIEIKLTSKRSTNNKTVYKDKVNPYIKQWIEVLKKIESRRSEISLSPL